MWKRGKLWPINEHEGTLKTKAKTVSNHILNVYHPLPWPQNSAASVLHRQISFCMKLSDSWLWVWLILTTWQEEYVQSFCMSLHLGFSKQIPTTLIFYPQGSSRISKPHSVLYQVNPTTLAASITVKYWLLSFVSTNIHLWSFCFYWC